MEYLAGVISLVSLVFNYLIYKRITATYMVGSVEEFQLVPPVESISEFVELHEHRYPQANGQGFPLNQCLDCGYWNTVDGKPPKTQGAYSAWSNQKEIPWTPPVTPPEPLIKAPNRPPLARPDGFV